MVLLSPTWWAKPLDVSKETHSSQGGGFEEGLGDPCWSETSWENSKADPQLSQLAQLKHGLERESPGSIMVNTELVQKT